MGKNDTVPLKWRKMGEEENPYNPIDSLSFTQAHYQYFDRYVSCKNLAREHINRFFFLKSILIPNSFVAKEP